MADGRRPTTDDCFRFWVEQRLALHEKLSGVRLRPLRYFTG